MLLKNHDKVIIILEKLITKIFSTEYFYAPNIKILIDMNALEGFLLTGYTVGNTSDKFNYTIKIYNSGLRYRNDIDCLDNCRIGDYLNYRINKLNPKIDFRKIGVPKQFVNLLFITLHEIMHIVDFLDADTDYLSTIYLQKQALSLIKVTDSLMYLNDMAYPYMSCVLYRNIFPEKQVNERVVEFVNNNLQYVLDILDEIVLEENNEH